jgi:hypothetical protein
MSSSIRRAATISLAVGAVLAMGACAAVSGLDALEVCRDATCADGGGDGAGGDGTTSDDGSTTGTDAGRDARRDGQGGGGVTCGSESLVCTSPNVCCLGATPSCAPSCADGTPTITCARQSDCRGENQVCCGTNLGADSGASGTACMGVNSCRGAGSRILCDPNGVNTCGTDTCGGTIIVGGQTLHYCN